MYLNVCIVTILQGAAYETDTYGAGYEQETAYSRAPAARDPYARQAARQPPRRYALFHSRYYKVNDNYSIITNIYE